MQLISGWYYFHVNSIPTGSKRTDGSNEGQRPVDQCQKQ